MITLSAFGDEISPDLEIQMDFLASEGIYYLDLRGVGEKNVLQLSDEEIAEIKRRLDARGFLISSIASPIGISLITDDFTPQLNDLMRAIYLAKFFGTPFIRIRSFMIPKGENPLKYRNEVLRRIKEMALIAEQEDVILLLENDTTMYGDIGERAQDILQSINSPHLRFAFDPVNFIRSSVLPMTHAYALVEHYISYIHMKDIRIDTGEVVPAGDGDAEIIKLLTTLKEKKYSGFISIEPRGTPGIADPDFFPAAAKALKRLLHKVGLKWNGNPNLSTRGKFSPPSVIMKSQAPFPSPCPPVSSSETVDSWIPLTPLEKMEQTEYDVLIVGSGAGGGAALWRLCDQWRNNGKRVGMIEAGDLLLSTHVQNLALLSGGHAEQYISSITRPIGRTLPEFSGAKQIFALGGRTIQWAAASPRIPSYLISKWPVPIKEMKFYYNIAEQVMNVNKTFSQSSLPTRIILKRLWANGFFNATGIPFAVDIKSTKYGEIRSNAIFSSILFLAEALNHKSFDLAVQARAIQLLTEKGKTVGVKVISPDMKSYWIKAKSIVLSGSTFETPRLLLHSGIPGEAIGNYLIDHSAVRATGTINRKFFPEDLGLIGVLIPNTKDNPYQIEFGVQEKPLQDELEIIIHGYGNVEPRFENRVFLDLNRKDKYGVPKIQVNFHYSQRDLAVIQQLTAGMRQVISSLNLIECQPTIFLRPPGEDNHEAGTCRIGDNPYTSATNRYGQIHGISGLYVADNSVLPTLGANPTLSTVALAIRTADYIIHQLK
ncbi:choline dehydrogenase-like flavoprotein/sugar phosphate isomerase/epimerase [Neobacillus niacini]|uniref:TIM barrel protein n=1 Tax=Neobacillus niacini TaxID=86668 RepID=UPI0027847C11|nr:TIM barrel protein [Neobacillus niacini]MDQ1005282.1 choline dehydrogenase-like flavoprotein/sugar phosphate isomerase/epimerase [Neobacillus niacini]